MGLIGGSIALRARAGGAIVAGWDAAAAACDAALEAGVVDRIAPSFEELARDADVLVLAAPLDAILAQLAILRSRAPRAALVLDVASVKAPVAEAARGLENFVGTHPIAGSERSGAGAARADLFEEKTWTYDAAAPAHARDGARTVIAAMGARPLAIASQDHDRIVALTSHLPQMLSTLLGTRVAEVARDPLARALCGTGMASMLRLGRSAWPVWEPILRANRIPVAQEVRALAAVLIDAARRLESDAVATFENDFDAAQSAAVSLESPGPEQRPTR